MYKSLFFLTDIGDAIVELLIQGELKKEYRMHDLYDLIRVTARRPSMTPQMISRCLKVILPPPYPRKYQYGKDRAYYVQLPSEEDMVNHLKNIGPARVKDRLKDFTPRKGWD